MRTRIYTLRYSATLGGFDDTQLQNLQRDTELLSVETRFFSVGGIPHIALIVCWQEAPLRGEIEAAGKAIAASIPAVQPYAAEAARHDDLLGGIEERDRKLYETLRRWRGELARREGIPPYLILSNKEMLLVVLKKPTSSNALMGIPGIGKGKVQRHG